MNWEQWIAAKRRWWHQFLMGEAVFVLAVMFMALASQSAPDAPPIGYVAVGLLLFGVTALIGQVVRDIVWSRAEFGKQERR